MSWGIPSLGPHVHPLYDSKGDKADKKVRCSIHLLSLIQSQVVRKLAEGGLEFPLCPGVLGKPEVLPGQLGDVQPLLERWGDFRGPLVHVLQEPLRKGQSGELFGAHSGDDMIQTVFWRLCRFAVANVVLPCSGELFTWGGFSSQVEAWCLGALFWL